ncbi:MAG: transcriptional regulator [Nitrososphaerales archaeon]
MARDKMIGAALLAGAVIGVIIYLYLMWFGYALVLLQITASVAVIAVLAILGWIGYVMATTPPPVPLEAEQPATAEVQPPTPEKK